jgi:hypothetical protein
MDRTRERGVRDGSGRESFPLDKGRQADDTPCQIRRLTIASSLSLLCISVSATIYASGIDQLAAAYGTGIEVATLGVSVYQLGFAFGPLCWVSPFVRFFS